VESLLLIPQLPPLLGRLPCRITALNQSIHQNFHQSEHTSFSRRTSYEAAEAGGDSGSQVDEEVGGGGDGGGLGELVGLGGPLEHGVDVANIDDGLERRGAAASEGERLAALLGGRRRLVPLPDQRPAQALLLPASRHRLGFAVSLVLAVSSFADVG
jgi:hypothetical protein